MNNIVNRKIEEKRERRTRHNYVDQIKEKMGFPTTETKGGDL